MTGLPTPTMQQDDFRALLSTPRARVTDVPVPAARRKTEAPAFKPRDKSKSKDRPIKYESGNTYVDRAKERREQEAAGAVEEYKGLNLDLLRQEKERLAAQEAQEVEHQLDDLLDVELPKVAIPSPDVPPEASTSKKRTREEMLQALRTGKGTADAPPAEEAILKSKFRKIAQQPAAAAPTAKPKKLRKKKKQKVEDPAAAPAVPPAPVLESPAEAPPVPPAAESELPQSDSDQDIFGGAGYKLSDSEAEGSEGPAEPEASAEAGPSTLRNWFGDGDADVHADPIAAPAIPKREIQVIEEDANDRLKGLEGSAVDDIRALLQADKAAEKAEKRKEWKEKMRAKQGLPGADDGEPREKTKKKLTDKDKLNRDYQQLQSELSKRGKE